MKHKCKACGYEWIARVHNPKQCPRCKRYDFEQEIAARKKFKKQKEEETKNENETTDSV